MPKTRPPYPEGFRRDAVGLVRAGGSIRDVAHSLGVSQQMLRNWAKQNQLDRRERDDAAIAERIVITKRAVERHINSLFSKLGLADSEHFSGPKTSAAAW